MLAAIISIKPFWPACTSLESRSIKKLLILAGCTLIEAPSGTTAALTSATVAAIGTAYSPVAATQTLSRAESEIRTHTFSYACHAVR